MAIASLKMSFEEFLNYDDGTNTLYELENGELIAIPSESEVNRRIAAFLFAFFLRTGIPSYQLSMKTELAVSGLRKSVRVPDLLIFSKNLAKILEGASLNIGS